MLGPLVRVTRSFAVTVAVRLHGVPPWPRTNHMAYLIHAM